MDQEKFGKIIKEIRKKNNLTQNDLANKYNVTYQAVSKWETGKNMPDMALIKQISKDFNISLEEMLDIPKKNKKPLLLIILTTIIIALIIVIILLNSSSFKFKTISSNCNNFNISGTIAYNKNKTAIHITNIEYCETNDIVEQIGVNKSKEIINSSDLIILVLNYNEEITKEELDLINELKNKKLIVYINKNDLEKKLDESKIKTNNIV